VFAGADAVMLSGETAIGKFPARAVEFMARIAREVEQVQATEPSIQSPPAKLVEARHRTAALAHGAFAVAADYGAKFIAVWSQHGGGARLLSQNNFTIPILAFSSDRAAVRRMQILRGVFPVPADPPRSLSGFTVIVDRLVLETGLAKPGDRCILIAGSPVGMPGATNALALHEVGCPTSGFTSHSEVS
jgi:pyruvate kinase